MNAAVDGNSVFAGCGCWAVGWGKVGGTKAFKHFGNVAWQGDGDAVLVESDVHAEVGIAGGFNCELVIVRLESLDKVVSVFLCSIFDV